MKQVSESSTNLIAEGSRVEGKITLDHLSRVHGTVVGEIHALPGSTVILAESGVVEGNIHAETLIIDGFVRGDIRATGKVVVSGTGRVVGNVHTPALTIDFGAYFEGRSYMEDFVVTG